MREEGVMAEKYCINVKVISPLYDLILWPIVRLNVSSTSV